MQKMGEHLGSRTCINNSVIIERFLNVKYHAKYLHLSDTHPFLTLTLGISLPFFFFSNALPLLLHYLPSCPFYYCLISLDVTPL